MNNKFLLTAMALPMLFTACSQDELFEGVSNEMNMPEARGVYMDLAPVFGDLTDSRATWLDSSAKLKWDETDLISVYWLGEPSDKTSMKQLTGKFNSIFKTTDGNKFTSESMVFEGGNIAVYPGDVTFTKEGLLSVKVPLSQDETTVNKTPYISNYLNIQLPKKGQVEQIPGYNNGLYSPMKMAANVLYLNVDIANTEKLLTDFNFRVDSISLVTTTKKFTNEGKIVYSSQPAYDKGLVAWDDENAATEKDELTTIPQSTFVVNTNPSSEEITATYVEPQGNGRYQAKFVILPTQISADTFDKESKIVVYTNCGRIDLFTEVKTAQGAVVDKYNTVPTIAQSSTNVALGVVTNPNATTNNKQAIAQVLSEVTTSHNIAATEKSNFIGERMGKAFMRNVDADMSCATLDKSPVKTSADIINYVNIYKAMNSTEAMELVLCGENGVFVDLTKEAIEAVEDLNEAIGNVKVTLSMDDDITGVQLAAADAGYIYFIEDNVWEGVDIDELDLVLPAGTEWSMDDNSNLNKVGKIINKGTLTVTGSANGSLNETVENRGILKIEGNRLQIMNNLINVYETIGNVTTNGVVKIGAGQDLVFGADITEGLSGTIEVAEGAFMTIAAGVNVTSEAVINNNGQVAAKQGTGGLINKGTINILNDNAIAYVQNNRYGVINLKSRDNEVVVNEYSGEIVYNYDSATDGKIFAYDEVADKFTYVVFGEGNNAITLADHNVYGATSDDISDLSMEFRGETTLVTNNLHFETLRVAAGAHLKVLSGNILSVHNLIVDGRMTVGGVITYLNNYKWTVQPDCVGAGAVLDGIVTVATKDEAVDAIAEGKDVVLTTDIALSDEVLANAEGVTIEGVTGTEVLTVNGSETTVANGLNLKNVVLSPNITVTDNGGSDWYKNMLLINGESKFENVTITKPIIVAADAEFNNVSIEPTGWTSYSMVIAPVGQTVKLTNCTFDASRGIQVSNVVNEQFAETASKKADKVTLIASKTSFETSAKAAIIVRNVGATINLSEVDITNVSADSTNAVWLDKDATCSMDDVTVVGGKVVVEQ